MDSHITTAPETSLHAPYPAFCVSRTPSTDVPFGRSLGAARVVVLCARSVSLGGLFAVLLPIRGGLQSGYGRAPTDTAAMVTLRWPGSLRGRRGGSRRLVR